MATESDLETAFAQQLQDLIGRLSNRDRIRVEADIQADVRQLLLTGGLGLEDHDLEVDLEAPVAGHRRIDVEVGYTVIEIKRDLRKASVARMLGSSSPGMLPAAPSRPANVMSAS
jgi:hypothetical protein